MTVDGLSASARTRLLAFLEAAVPKMEHALAENEQSDTFDDDARSAAAARYEDDTGGRLGPECVHALDPRPSTRTKADAGSSRDERFWRDLVPTGLSWNRSGYSIAVSYGRFDVTGWCDSPGALCVWNLRREDVDPRKPDSIFETDSCLQCVAWHPVEPAVVAAGSFDGEVHVWDVRGDADGDGDGDGKENVLGKRSNDGFVARSAISDASHREPVVSVAWLRSARAAGTRAGRGATRTHDVCSFGSDGRVLVWDFSKAEITREDAEDPSERSKTDPTVRRVPFPSFGYETRPPADAGRERGFVRGIAAASFIPTARASGDPSSANTANTVTTVTTGTVQNAHVRAREGSPSSTSSFLLGCDGGAVLECLMRHGAEAGAAAFARECAAGSVPAMRSPATAEYEPHRGAAHGVCAHPSEPGLFLSCGADGALAVRAARAKVTRGAAGAPRRRALLRGVVPGAAGAGGVRHERRDGGAVRPARGLFFFFFHRWDRWNRDERRTKSRSFGGVFRGWAGVAGADGGAARVRARLADAGAGVQPRDARVPRRRRRNRRSCLGPRYEIHHARGARGRGRQAARRGGGRASGMRYW